uniref:Putative chemosensory protein n=1 Tax=Triatoma brasiliensis TaxID=65344 RepID=A0A162RQA8_TRIBS|nr:putative chemosensory protein [Triatoma brasiliensis]
MKCTVVFFIATIFGAVICDEGKYTTKYDNIDLDEILNNDRIYEKYFLCLKGEGKCTPDGRELKVALPDALKTRCVKCSEKQRAGTEKVLRFILDKKPNDYLVLEKIYDPDRMYRVMYKEDAEKLGLKFPTK